MESVSRRCPGLPGIRRHAEVEQWRRVVVDQHRHFASGLSANIHRFGRAAVVLRRTGDDDHVLVVTARDVDDYDALMRRLVAANANVKRLRTRVALHVLKRGLAVPVDALPA